MNRRLLVDLEALADNYAGFAEAAQAGSPGAVVKADGYGHGALPVASQLQLCGCTDFFVASAEEGLNLRASLPDKAGEQSTIYVFEGVSTDATAALLARAQIVPVLNDLQQLEYWRPHRRLPIAVHIDTGMSRLGFSAAIEAEPFAEFQLQLLMTHLACADEVDHSLNAVQVARFDAVRERFPGVVTSIGNSAGWLTGERLQGDLGRIGIGLYGGNPFTNRDNPTRAVASLQGQVLQIRELQRGETVGYGATLAVDARTTVAVVALGYADGVPRQLSNRGQMAVNGQRCRILGRVSMDMVMIDVTAVGPVAVGDWVECFGAVISVDEVAAWADTIAYEVLTGVGPRVERVYLPTQSPPAQD